MKLIFKTHFWNTDDFFSCWKLTTMLDIFFISSATNTHNTSYNIALYIIVFIVLNFLPITSCNKSHNLWIEVFRHAQIYIIPPLCNGNRCNREIKNYRWCACICHGIFNILSNLPTHLFIKKSHLVYGQHPLKFCQICVNIGPVTKCNMAYMYLLKRTDGCWGEIDDIHKP